MSNYWKKRLDEQEQWLLDQEIAAADEHLKKLYTRALRDTERDINKLYDIVARELKSGDIKMNDLYKYNRYFELMNNLNNRLVRLGGNEIRIMDERMLSTFENVQDIITMTLPAAISFSAVSTGTVEQIISKIWCADGLHWTDRI